MCCFCDHVLIVLGESGSRAFRYRVARHGLRPGYRGWPIAAATRWGSPSHAIRPVAPGLRRGDQVVATRSSSPLSGMSSIVSGQRSRYGGGGRPVVSSPLCDGDRCGTGVCRHCRAFDHHGEEFRL
jgi:hypothetical protein